MHMPILYLASQSPRRRELLSQLGYSCELLLADEHEDAEALEVCMANESPDHYVQRVTQLKAQAALARWTRRRLAHGLIITADTTVALNNDILGKPASRQDAAHMLEQLSGQWHEVFTAVAVVHTRTHSIESALSRSEVKMAPLSPLDIASYIETGEPMDKAGSYGIQGKAGGFIEHIRGSYTGIMGLPLFETRQLLLRQATLSI